MSKALVSVLKPDTIYATFDRFVCSETRCCGYTARVSGVDIDGHRLRPIDARDLAEWPVAELGPISCECGRLVANHGGRFS